MLNVQEFLQTKTLADLESELSIKVNRHDKLPLVILNYNQIDSPKTHPVVRECRGLVLHSETHEVVAKSFSRFFNWGEVAEEMDDFDFSDFSVQSKEDGSLVLIYFYDGLWRANTRGSFALDTMQFQSFTWQDGICEALADNLEDVGVTLNTQFTFVCEFCSPWNKIVRTYSKPVMYLLTAFHNKTLEELTVEQCDGFAKAARLLRPELYTFSNIEEIQGFLQEQEASDPTFEGVVIKDKDGRRWKIKSATYLGLHRLKGEGDNMWNPKHLLPFILAGEEDELLTYFPEVSETFYKTKCKVLENYAELVETWADYWRIKDQKDFALAIKTTPFASILFSVRSKHGEDQKSADVRQAWREADRMILKRLFGKS